jgi:hypothetical protein
MAHWDAGRFRLLAFDARVSINVINPQAIR